MHAMSPMVAVTRVSPIAAEITHTDTEGLSPQHSLLLSWLSQALLDISGVEKKVQL
jgi:hypothetical protein